MLSVIPPSKFGDEKIRKFIDKITKKKGFFRKELLEDITLKGMVWMPYHRIRYAYSRSREDLIRSYGKTGRGETALNAMFCGAVKNESDVFMLFRPNNLQYRIRNHQPQSEEVVGPVFHADFDAILTGLLKRLNRVKEELYELRSTLSKSRLRTRRYSMVLPVLGHLRRNEEELSKKVARLSATKNILSLCLNVNADIDSIEVMSQSVFYYPNLVVELEHRENGTERYLIINLVKSDPTSRHLNCDQGLTELCNTDSMCKELIARAFASKSLGD